MQKFIVNPQDPFQPTCTKPGEIKKAYYKNLNLSVLQHWYMGDPDTALECLITGEPAWITVPDRSTGEPKLRFRLDFNHIRQQNRFLLGLTKTKSPGRSVDKNQDPSALFRAKNLALAENSRDLTEFMCCIPITLEQHKYVTQDSSLAHMSLDNFDRWPWGLQNSTNFNTFQKHYWGTHKIDYDLFIAMLRDPLAQPYYLQDLTPQLRLVA